MLRDYVKGTGIKRARPKPTATPPPSQDPMVALQAQWSKVLARCYELYAEGKRCVHEDDPTMRFNCSKCEYRDEGPFCKANVFLKRVVSLVAEHLANKRNQCGATPPQAPGDSAPTDADDATEPLPPLTQQQVAEFKAQGAAYEIKTPLCDEPVWLVPERTGQARFEFTPEEIHFILRAASTLEGTLVEISRALDTTTPGAKK